MTTRLISLAEYRSNISTLWKEAKEKNIRYVVMVRSEPVFEVTPIHSSTFSHDFVPELREIPQNEIPASLGAKIEASKKKPVSSFRNL
ncbi:MAG: hypothetical protein QG650_390 [Patescibacteria group bacterium]|nr:hypothetical protein [Patescibacteria group bacterium]